MEASRGGTARGWLDRVPSWTFLAILGGLVGAAFLLSWAFPETFWNPEGDWRFDDKDCPGSNDPLPSGSGFFFDYYWFPILCDEGYNNVNTATWAVLLGLLLLWAYRFTVELREHVGTGLVLAVVPFLVWGSVYRVLEDADLFAPYCDPTKAGCLPGPAGAGFLDEYLGVFFITPIIYVEILFIAIGLLLWGHRARRVADAKGLARGVQYFAYSMVLLVAAYTALWAAGPSYIRFVAPPWVALLAAAVAFWIVWRYSFARNRFSPHVALGAYGMFFLLLGLYYVLVWMTGGVDIWHGPAPDPLTTNYPLPLGELEGREGIDWPVQWWVFAAAIIAPALVTYACWKQGLILGGARAPTGATPKPTYNAGVTFLVIILLVEAIAVFATVVGMRDFAQRQIAGDWATHTANYASAAALVLAGPAVLAAGILLTRRAVGGGLGVHGALLHYATPVNLLMVFGQMTDALMTSLGIDLFHYREKHVLPRFLIRTLEDANLPGPLGDYPTAMVMITLKLLIVLLVVVAIDATAGRDMKGRENLVGLVKLGIIMVGLSPGVRDAVRLAMAT